MKKFKKMMALVLSMVMVLAMGVTAFAAGTEINPGGSANENGNYMITVDGSDTHTYKVFQVLTGTLIAGQEKLGNPEWGDDVTDEAKKREVNDFIDELGKYESEAGLAEAVTDIIDTSKKGKGTVSKDNPVEVEPGYYVLVDVTTGLADGDAYSLNIVRVFNNVKITPKKGTTQSDKKVDDKNDSNSNEDGEDWQDSADYDIDDEVPFQLTATIADDYANYTHGYKLTFHDIQSAGLKFIANTVEVFVDGVKIDEGYYEVVTEGLSGGETFQIKFDNLREIDSVQAGSVIKVTYRSCLTGDAVVIGKDGNPNESYVTYSNNPNDNQAGENGKTPNDKVVVFTYKLDVDKIDSSNNALEGAGFTLYKRNANDVYEPVGAEVKGEAMTNFEWKGLDDGDYRLEETTTPAGYNTIEPIEFTISAKHGSEEGEGFDLTEFTVTQDQGLVANLDSGTIKKKDGTDKDVQSGEIFGEIVNQQGSTLPSTGGIGTTIFYIVGAILVIGAGIVLITKKRMANR